MRSLIRYLEERGLAEKFAHGKYIVYMLTKDDDALLLITLPNNAKREKLRDRWKETKTVLRHTDTCIYLSNEITLTDDCWQLSDNEAMMRMSAHVLFVCKEPLEDDIKTLWWEFEEGDRKNESNMERGSV